MADQHLRMKQIIGTTSQWATCDIVLGLGEFGVEQTADGAMLKVGDGASKFSSLPYITGSGSSVHIGTTPPTKKSDGDLWFDPTTGALKIYDQAAGGWTLIVNTAATSPWSRVPNGIQYVAAGKSVGVGPLPGTPEKFNVDGNAKITATVFANEFDGQQVTANHADIKIYNGDKIELTQWTDGTPTATGTLHANVGTFEQSVTAGNVWVSNQGDTVGGTQVPALLSPTGQIIRGGNVVFGQIIKDADGVYRIRFTSADGSDHDINMMGQTITNLPNAATHPNAYNMLTPTGAIDGAVADSAASVRWVENKFGSITGMNFRGAKDVIDGGDSPPTAFEANDWYIVRQDSYDDKGKLVGLMSDAWWDLLTPYSKLARTDEQGHQIREVFAGDHLIWADTVNPANSGFAYIENSNHHNRFISRFGDKMAGVLTLLKRTSKQNERPILYAGHGFNLGCFGAPFTSDGVTYPDGDTLSLNAGGGAGASQIEFVVNDGAGTRYHQISMAGNGSLRIPVSGSAYTPPGGIMLQQNNIHTGAHNSNLGVMEYLVVAKHDSATTRKPFSVRFPVRGATTPEVLIDQTGVISGVSPGVGMTSVVVLSQLQPYLDKTATGGQHQLNQGLNMNNFRISNLPLPSAGTQPVTVNYLKDNSPTYNKTLHVINMKEPQTGGVNCRLINVADPVNPQDAMTLASFNSKTTTVGGAGAFSGKIPELDAGGRLPQSMLPAALSHALDFIGGINITAQAPAGAKDGYTYFATASGTMHASFGLGAIHVNSGDMVIYASGKWHVIANEVDLSAVYTKVQSDAKYALKGDAYTKAQSDGKYALTVDVHSLPAGGGAGQVLEKINGTDYNVHWVTPAAQHGIPTGGTKGQVLEKLDGTNYNAHWVTLPTHHGIPTGGTTGQFLAKTSGTNYDAHWVSAYTTAQADARFVQLTQLTTTGGSAAQAAKVPKLNSSGKIPTNMLPAGLSGAMNIKGSVRPGSSPPAKNNGDAHFISTSGTLNAGYGLGSIAVNAGDLLIYTGGAWHIIANEMDLNDAVRLHPAGGLASNQVIGGGLILSRLETTIGGLHSKHSIQGDDLAGTGDRYVYADAGGTLHSGVAYPAAGGLTQATADGRYLRTGASTSGAQSVNGSVTVGATLRANGTLSGHTLYADTTTQLHGRVDIYGDVNMHAQHIANMQDPSAGMYAANKRYVDSAVSDARVKQDVTELHGGLEAIMALNPVSYTYTDDKYTKGRNQTKYHGFIAQEVQDVIPDLIYHDPMDRDDEGKSVSGNDLLGFDKSDLVPTLVNAVKELKAEIDQLKKDLADARSN